MDRVPTLAVESLPRILILTADSGGGHRAAAQSLTDALGGQARVTWLNLLDEHAPFPFNTWSGLYGPCVTSAPWLYHAIYRSVSTRARFVGALRAVYPCVHRAIAVPLLAQEADLVISVHPLQIDIPMWILRATGQHVPFITVVTDPVTPPVAWFSPNVDLCIVATESAREAALACGLTPRQVQVIGLPIRSAFLAARDRTKPAARAWVGQDPDRPLVLVSGGGAGIGRLRPIALALAGRLAAHPARPQLAIITGRNQELQRRLDAEHWPLPVRVLGFVENMADWVAAADLLITKAGPGTLAEAACLGVPTLITDYIPGQEAGNVAWAAEHGTGIYEPHPIGIAGLADELLRPGNPALGDMSVRARNMSRPEAASEIAHAALSFLAIADAKSNRSRKEIS